MEKKLKLFYFEGQGNYSHIFGWDNGLSASIESEVSFEEALERVIELESYSPSNYSYSFPGREDEMLPGAAYYNQIDHGSSRNVDGYISAYNREEAEEVLDEIVSFYPVVEYEADDELEEDTEEDKDLDNDNWEYPRDINGYRK